MDTRSTWLLWAHSAMYPHLQRSPARSSKTDWRCIDSTGPGVPNFHRHYQLLQTFLLVYLSKARRQRKRSSSFLWQTRHPGWDVRGLKWCLQCFNTSIRSSFSEQFGSLTLYRVRLPVTAEISGLNSIFEYTFYVGDITRVSPQILSARIISSLRTRTCIFKWSPLLQFQIYQSYAKLI